MKILQIIPYSKKENSFIFARREFRILKEVRAIEAEVFFLNTRKGIFQLVKQIFNLRRIITSQSFTHVHAQYGTLTSVIALAVAFRKKLVVTYRGSDINGSLDVSWPRRFVAIFLSWWSMRFADGVIFVSPALYENSPRFGGKAVIIPSGVDLSLFHPIDDTQAKLHLKLRLEKKYLLFYSGNESANKRKDFAVTTLAILKQWGYSEFELMEISGNIEPDLMPFYFNSAAAVLMLSDREGSPTIVQEAIACGTPVVSVEVGDVSSMIVNVENALIVERNPESIATGVLSVTQTGKIKPTAESLERVCLQTCVERIVQLYKDL